MGACACGAVRFQVTKPFTTAGYCHCTRCRHRTGTMWSPSGTVSADAIEILEGEDEVRTWRPPDGFTKSFCGICGGQVFGGDVEGTVVVVRLGALDGDPGIEPRWHQWVSSAPSWEPLPDDGLPRFPGPREHD
jgi:hypothetical protein